MFTCSCATAIFFLHLVPPVSSPFSLLPPSLSSLLSAPFLSFSVWPHIDGVLVVEAGEQREALEYAFPHVSFTWLTTSVGDNDVFLLDKQSYNHASNNNNKKH